MEMYSRVNEEPGNLDRLGVKGEASGHGGEPGSGCNTRESAALTSDQKSTPAPAMVIGDEAPADLDTQSSGDEAGTAPEDRKFRPDVQGLRAVAVMLVVLFHAHVPGLGGGYVGVDIFFVISGFVITGVLLREHASTGATSILNFYGRRSRRIIPAATLVIITVVIGSYVLLGPLTGAQTAGDGRWASVFLINIHFATGGTNYLASQLPPSVLQNFWSLAVEEQFYLVYPTIFLAVSSLSWRLSLRRRLGIALGVAVVASFVTSIVQTSTNPTSAYFSPFPRVWELALGGLVAVCTISLRRLPAPFAAVLTWIGLGSILVAAFLFTSTTAYPGGAVALPVVGAALIIAGGVAEPAYGVERILRLRPFQWIGMISYSLYLWHWPVLTIAAERKGTESLPVTDALLWVLLSLGLAIITYLLVENPIRHSTFLISKRWASLALGGCLIVSSLTVATAEIHLHDQVTLATPGLANLKTTNPCPSPTKQELTSLMGTGPTTSHRLVARLMVVGDSTACTMLPGLEAVGAPLGVRVENAAVIGCGIVSGQIPYRVNGKLATNPTRFCQSRADAAETRALRQGRPNIVLWASSWEMDALLIGSTAKPKVLVQGSPQWYAVLLRRMEQRIRQFTATGATVVMLTQPAFADFGKPTVPTPEDKDFERLNALLAKFALHKPHVELVNLAAHVCPSGPPCPLLVDNVFVRADGAHYTAEGSLWVARWLMPRLGIKSLDKPTNPLPVMSIVIPSNGKILKGSQLLLATAPYHLGISKVEFRISGETLNDLLIGTTLFTQEWQFLWNTTTVPNGTYTLRSVAYGAGRERSTSPGVTVRVAN
jgi:peptidoglycan/LPS O-acetylase OafA/YrhL